MITNKTFDEIKVGETARMQRTLTKQEIELFGLLSGDMNPTHFSDEYARMLLERHKLVGHSMWGGALISSILGNDLPGPGTVYQSQNLDFHDAVELGDVLEITVTAKSKNPDWFDFSESPSRTCCGRHRRGSIRGPHRCRLRRQVYEGFG